MAVKRKPENDSARQKTWLDRVAGPRSDLAVELFTRNSSLEGRTRKLERGQTLFLAEEGATTAFLIREGVLMVTCSSPDGREAITSIYFPGEICAGLSVLTQSSYMDNARAPRMSETLVTPISRTELADLATRVPDFDRNLILVEREKQRFKNQLLLGRVGETCRQRTAGVLLWLDRQGVTQSAKTYLCREELANLVGSAPETVIRVLSEFRKDGLVRENGVVLTVDTHALEDLIPSSNVCEGLGGRFPGATQLINQSLPHPAATLTHFW